MTDIPWTLCNYCERYIRGTQDSSQQSPEPHLFPRIKRKRHRALSNAPFAATYRRQSSKRGPDPQILSKRCIFSGYVE